MDSAITLRLPDEKYQCLKERSRRRGISVNRLIDEMTTLMLAEFDLETRFVLRTQRDAGKQVRGSELGGIDAMVVGRQVVRMELAR